MNFWKKLQNQMLSFKKVGDVVDLSGMETNTRQHAGCPLCHDPTDEEIESGHLFTFNAEDLCLKHLTDMQS